MPNPAYLELKIAWNLFGGAADGLAAGERAKLRTIARRQELIETRVLQSPEAAGVVIPEALVEERLAAIVARYSDDSDVEADLARLGMTRRQLRDEVARDLVIEFVLERVGAGAPPVTDTEAEIFYHLHPDRFTRPERRQLRHLLVTCGSVAERRAARQLLERLRPGLIDGDRFAAAAQRYSHCPTALDGGRLGSVARGKLYPELEQAAFALNSGQISPVIATEMGLHLVRCDAVEPPLRLQFGAVRTAVVQRLTESRQEQWRRAWIARVSRPASPAST